MTKFLNMITMNCEKVTAKNIEIGWNFFDRFIIVDGNMRHNNKVLDTYIDVVEKIEKRKPYVTVNYDQEKDIIIYGISKLTVVDRAWDDNFPDAYWTHLDMIKEGDWALILDSDEMPSELLLSNLDKIIEKSNNGFNYDLVRLPSLDVLDGEPLWTYEDIPQKYHEGMWTKNILIRKPKYRVNLYYFGGHVIPLGEKYTYYPFPYLHIKNVYDLICDDMWQAVLCPEGQRLTKLESARFRQALAAANIRGIADFKEKMNKGEIGPLMEKLAYEYRKSTFEGSHELHPFCKLYYQYYFLSQHGKPPPDDTCTLDWCVNYIREMKKTHLPYKKFREMEINNIL